MTWPQATDYNAAVQNPQLCFRDDDLRQGRAAGDLFGLPRPHAGNFADVYQIQGADHQSWAVKCFTRPVANLHQRYQAISGHLRQTQRAFMVEFHYLEEGICIRGQWYPLVKMRWVEGFRLNEFVREHLGKPALLERLAQMWVRLAQELRDADMAHGDLQHGNVLLVPGSKSSSLVLRLIDYDGMFVPSLRDTPSGEIGHPNFQHPQRLREGGYDRGMDAFSHLLIYTALRCLRVGGAELWQHYDNSENLLFREEDFRQPSKSRLLRELWSLKDRDARDLVGHLLLASQDPLQAVPSLDELVAEGVVRPLGGGAEARINALLGDEPLARPSRVARAAPTMTAIEIVASSVATMEDEAAAPTQRIALEAGPPRLSTPPLPRSLRRKDAAVVQEGRSKPPSRRALNLSAFTDPVVGILSRPMWLATLGALTLVSFLVVNVLVWSTVKPAPAPPAARRPSLDPIADVTLTGGRRSEVVLRVERHDCPDTLTIHVDGLPADMTSPVLTLPPEKDAVSLSLLPPLDVEVPAREVFVSLWREEERLQEDRFRLAVRKGPRPLLRQPESIRCKAGGEVLFAADVDRRGCAEPLTLHFDKLPPGVRQESLPGRGDEPPRVKLTVAADAPPQELVNASLTLRVGDLVADTKPLAIFVENATPRVRLKKDKGPDSLTVKAGGKAELLVFVERNDYKGSVEIRLDDRPPGVMAATVTVPEAVSFAALTVEVEADAEAGRHIVKLQTLVDGLKTDERNLTLTVEAKPPSAAREPARQGERVTFATVDGVELVGTLYPGALGKQGACVLMLHEMGQHRRTPGWQRLAAALHAEGHTVLTFDFRGHGESKRIRPIFWQFGVNQYLPAFRQGKAEESLPETFDAAGMPPTYLPWLVHDVAAARLFLDLRHDDPTSTVNSYNLVVFAAGSGATIGSLWLDTEGFRFNALRAGVAIKPDWVKNRDVQRAVWLGIERKWKKHEYPLTDWVRKAYKPHPDTDPNSVVPTDFLFGAEDVESYRLVSQLVAGGVGDSRPIPGARQMGTMLLEKNPAAERFIRSHLLRTLSNLTMREWSPRRLDIYRSLWGIPNGSKMDFYLARQPGEWLLREVPLKRFRVRMDGLVEPHRIPEPKKAK